MEAGVAFCSLKGLTIKGSRKWAWVSKGKTFFFLIKVLQCVHALMGMTLQRRRN